MASPFKQTTGADVPLKGVDQYGGTKDDVKGNNTKGDDGDVYSTGALPKGVDEHGGTEDLAENGAAAKKYGVKRIPGMG